MEQARLQEHEALVSGLLDPRAYPHHVERVERIDTHISTVLLAGDFAYKIKKPVELGFLDFSSLDRRYQACLDELRLNRRTAGEPDHVCRISCAAFGMTVPGPNTPAAPALKRYS